MSASEESGNYNEERDEEWNGECDGNLYKTN
jgi:hypothetical protein